MPKKMKKPEKGKKPKRITTDNPPGGPRTPGVRKYAEKARKENKYGRRAK